MNKIGDWNGDWLGTNTGKTIDLHNPNPECFTIEDIATALSNMCRFNGQLKKWYSVAEHSIHVAELVPNEDKLAGLLHDATEAYLCDVPTPLKRMLGASYKDIETRLAFAIGDRFGVDLVNLPESVKYADRMMVVTERDALQLTPQSWGEAYEKALRYPNFTRCYDSPTHARHAFLHHFNKYYKSKGA